MRGFLSLEPDSATQARLVASQSRLRDAVTRQGVSFPDRLGITLLTWPFATEDELAEVARRLVSLVAPPVRLYALDGRPSADRPAEIGFAAEGLEPLQARLFDDFRTVLDPDPLRSAFVRLARVAPPSRKVGAALRGSGLAGGQEGPFGSESLVLWRQTPQGFEVCRTMPFEHGRP